MRIDVRCGIRAFCSHLSSFLWSGVKVGWFEDLHMLGIFQRVSPSDIIIAQGSCLSTENSILPPPLLLTSFRYKLSERSYSSLLLTSFRVMPERCSQSHKPGSRGDFVLYQREDCDCRF